MTTREEREMHVLELKLKMKELDIELLQALLVYEKQQNKRCFRILEFIQN